MVLSKRNSQKKCIVKMSLPADELIGVGGAIFETFNRFENSVDNAESVACGVDKLLFVRRFIV